MRSDRVVRGATAPGDRAGPRLAMLVLVWTAGAACSGVPNVATGGDVATGQTIMEMGEAVNALQAETALLQWQVDSLGAVLAQQDTVIRQLAGIAGVPVPVR
jgi:hypothetical protein